MLNRWCLRLEIERFELAMTGKLIQASAIYAIDLLANWADGELGI